MTQAHNNFFLTTDTDKDTYNSFVVAHNGSFLQSFEWGEWQKTLGRSVYRYFADNALAIQIIEHKLPFGQSYLYCPYGPVLNTKTQISDLKIVFEALFKQIRLDHPKALFVKLEPQNASFLAPYASFLVPSHHIQPGATLILDLAKSSEQLLAEMESKTRYSIRTAEKRGAKVTKMEISENTIQATVKMITATQNRHGYHGHSYAYYENLLKFFSQIKPGKNSPNLSIFHALHESELLAVAVFLDFGQRRVYLYGGSDEKKRELYAPYLLHWTSIQDAQKNQLKDYDFWGIETSSGKTPGFVRFKLGFGGSQIKYPDALDYSIQPLKYQTYRVIKKIRNLLP